jgi:hypothetical protein
LLPKQQGYALLQLGIALSLVMVICMVSVPHRLFMQHRLVKTEIEKLMLMFRYIQRTALACNQDQQLAVHVDDNWYEAIGRREQLPKEVQFAVVSGVYGPPSHPEKPLTKPVTYKNNHIMFYANGTIQAGALYLVDTKKDVLYGLSTAVSSIAQVRAYRYDFTTHDWIAL